MPRRLQLPVPFGVNFVLSSRQHILRRDVADGTVQTNVVVMRPKLFRIGVGNGNRTRNRRSHSPVLCQLSYSHRRFDYSNCASHMSETSSRGSRSRAFNCESGCDCSLVNRPPLCKTFDSHGTMTWNSTFLSPNLEALARCCAAPFRTPRAPARNPHETVGGTSDAGVLVASLVGPGLAPVVGISLLSYKRPHQELNR